MLRCGRVLKERSVVPAQNYNAVVDEVDVIGICIRQASSTPAWAVRFPKAISPPGELERDGEDSRARLLEV